MITDVMDSIKFSSTENNEHELLTHKSHAYAAIVEAMIFHEEGTLALSAPQFFDGLAASDETWRKNIFDLIRKGKIKIALYNTPESKNPIQDIRGYLKNFVLGREFIYSSRPEISEAITSNRYVRETNQEVLRYILSETSEKPFLGTDSISKQFERMIDFFEEFKSIDNKEIYVLHTARYISYRNFIENAFRQSKLEDKDKGNEHRGTATLFNLLDVDEKITDQFITKLFECETRTATVKFLQENECGIDTEKIADIKQIMQVLYNKHTLSAYSKPEIHMPILDGTARQEAFERLVKTSDDNQQNGYRYENTEVLRHSVDDSAMSFDDILEIRAEIEELKNLDNLPSWQEALKKYKTNLYNISVSNRDELDYDFATQNGNRFFSKDLEAVDAAEKLDFLNNVKNDDDVIMKEDSYVI